MNSREIVLNAVNHRAGRLPVDFGASGITGIHCLAVEKLRKYYGLEDRPVSVYIPHTMLGYIDDDLREALGIDTVPILSQRSLYGTANTEMREWLTPWGQKVLISKEFVFDEDEKGFTIYPKGDKSLKPSGYMPRCGFFFDTIIRQNPDDLDEPKLEYNLEEFKELSDADVEYWANEAKKVREAGHKYCTVAHLPGTALGDVALVPAPFLANPRGVRDIEEWYMLIASDPEFISDIFAAQTEIAIKNLEKLKGALGDALDVAVICGTDFGTQNGAFCSVDKFREIWLPHYKKMNDWIHANTSWKTFKHSCGAVENFMQSFIDSGFDIINPVQCSAKGMDAAVLKQKYGDRLCFWGGGVDTQKILPFGTPDEVRKQVLERCEIFSNDGGFVFNAIHIVQANTPIENLVAMFEALKEFRK